MPIQKITNLKTMRQVAELCGVPYLRLWRRVREQKTIEEPKTQVGRRIYYDAYQVARVIEQVATLKDRGAI